MIWGFTPIAGWFISGIFSHPEMDVNEGYPHDLGNLHDCVCGSINRYIFRQKNVLKWWIYRDVWENDVINHVIWVFSQPNPYDLKPKSLHWYLVIFGPRYENARGNDLDDGTSCLNR